MKIWLSCEFKQEVNSTAQGYGIKTVEISVVKSKKFSKDIRDKTVDRLKIVVIHDCDS